MKFENCEANLKVPANLLEIKSDSVVPQTIRIFEHTFTIILSPTYRQIGFRMNFDLKETIRILHS